MMKGTFSNRPSLEPITREKLEAAIEEWKALRDEPIATKVFIRRDAWDELASRIRVVARELDGAAAVLPALASVDSGLTVFLVDELPLPWMTDLEIGRPLDEVLRERKKVR